jgi:hypothetical protein
MDQQVHVLTLATADLDAARGFYVEGLGWSPLLDVPGEIVFFQVAAGTVLAFFESAQFAQDLGAGPARPAVSGVTLAHNVADRDAVTALTGRMAAAGGTVLTPPEEGAFGGVFHALVRDPNGVVWEVAHNPGWSVDPDGTVRLAQPG